MTQQLFGFAAAVSAIREASKCRTCGKPRLVMNTAGYRRRYRPETVSIETHCACKAGPAHPETPQAPTHHSEGDPA